MKAAAKNIKLTALASAVLAAGLVVSSSAFAGGTTNMTVTAQIQGVCKIIAPVSALSFGLIDPSLLASVTATATFTTKCSNGTVETASTDNGGNNVLAGQKRMQTTAPVGNFLAYGVAYAGDTTTGQGFGAAIVANTVTITGTITPAQFQNATANATYTDTVVITVAP
jgi:spore coat protein U-like protein